MAVGGDVESGGPCARIPIRLQSTSRERAEKDIGIGSQSDNELPLQECKLYFILILAPGCLKRPTVQYVDGLL